MKMTEKDKSIEIERIVKLILATTKELDKGIASKNKELKGLLVEKKEQIKLLIKNECAVKGISEKLIEIILN